MVDRIKVDNLAFKLHYRIWGIDSIIETPLGEELVVNNGESVGIYPHQEVITIQRNIEEDSISRNYYVCYEPVGNPMYIRVKSETIDVSKEEYDSLDKRLSAVSL